MAQESTAAKQDDWVKSEISLGRARFVAQGCDPNEVEDICRRIGTSDSWIREWSVSGAEHAERASDAEAKGNTTSAGKAYMLAALSYHWGKMRWDGVLQDETSYRQALSNSVDSFWKGLRYLDPIAERVEIPYDGITMRAHLRRPPGVANPPVVILVSGYDSVKEEFYRWSNVFLSRGMATLAPDGPGQGETQQHMPIRHDYEGAGSAMIDFLEGRGDLDSRAVGAVGVSKGGYYAPRIACFEPRVKAVVSISGAFKSRITPQRVNAWAMFTHWSTNPEEVVEMERQQTLEGVIGNIRCPYLVVSGKLDAQSTYTNTEELAREAEAAGVNVKYVLYEDGAHVCFNIPYKYRPLVGDWMAAQLSNR